jgi:hypothetical protein
LAAFSGRRPALNYLQNTLRVLLWGPCEGSALIEKADWWTILDLNQ